jgi:hypothetical protein
MKNDMGLAALSLCSLYIVGRRQIGSLNAHDYIASTVFDLVSLAGITGTMDPSAIFSMAVPAEVLAAALAEDGSPQPSLAAWRCSGLPASPSTVVACCTT